MKIFELLSETIDDENSLVGKLNQNDFDPDIADSCKEFEDLIIDAATYGEIDDEWIEIIEEMIIRINGLLNIKNWPNINDPELTRAINQIKHTKNVINTIKNKQ